MLLKGGEPVMYAVPNPVSVGLSSVAMVLNQQSPYR